MPKQSKKDTPVEQTEKLELSANDSSDNEIDGFSDGEQQPDTQGSSTVKGEHVIKKLNLKNTKASKKDSDKHAALSGIIYVSRLPDGFYERELTTYFSQFGDLKDARLARNKKTGNSRHYAFVEFVNKEDAVVAQETMNNYLLMGHLLKVALLPKGKSIEKLFKHKKRVPRDQRITNLDKVKKRSSLKQAKRLEQLKESGIDFKW